MDSLTVVCLTGVWVLSVHIPGSTPSVTQYELNLVGFSASQSTEFEGAYGTPNLAIDGVVTTNYDHGSCTHTVGGGVGVDAWWSVDLTKAQAVTKVDMLNRGECTCYDRLSDVYIYLSESDYNTKPNTSECGKYNGAVTQGQWGGVTCSNPTVGRYLTVQLYGTPTVLTMCEVKVFVCYCCTTNFCKNGGTCTTTDEPTWECTCADGYTGDRCETNIDECEGQTCHNRGTCEDGIAQYTCDCNDGYTGDDCETDIDDCSPNPCENGGACSDAVNDYTCQCADGYTGDTCETDIDDCNPNPCKNGGACSDAVNDYTCQCVDGYVGDTCETDFDDCVGSSCGDHGECEDQVNGVQCNCEPGYTGDLCDSYNGCHTDPCQNGGVCRDLDAGVEAGYTCECTSNAFIGVDCQIETVCSQSNLCNHGECKNEGNTGTEYTCECENGYIGEHCDVVDPCGTTPCHNGGACTSNINGSYTCECPNGYLLPDCEQTDPCSTSPCQYGGTCDVDKSSESATAHCTCMEGFSGMHCESGPCELKEPCQYECKNNADGSGYECIGTTTKASESVWDADSSSNLAMGLLVCLVAVGVAIAGTE